MVTDVFFSRRWPDTQSDSFGRCTHVFFLAYYCYRVEQENCSFFTHAFLVHCSIQAYDKIRGIKMNLSMTYFFKYLPHIYMNIYDQPEIYTMNCIAHFYRPTGSGKSETASGGHHLARHFCNVITDTVGVEKLFWRHSPLMTSLRGHRKWRITASASMKAYAGCRLRGTERPCSPPRTSRSPWEGRRLRITGRRRQ